MTVRALALKCTLCKNKPIIVKSENELNLHFKDIHQDIRFCCYLCSSIFGDLTVLFTHIQRNHSELDPNVESVALFSEMTMSRVGYLAGNQNRCTADKVVSSIKNDIGPSNKPSLKRCCVKGCYSTYEDVPKPSFYRFPQLNIEQRKLWINVRIMSIRQGIK